MNFKSIHYFLTTAQEHSFTKAAGQLHITQQTLSADIAALEQELGQPLFLRRVPLQLTYAGEVFLRYARQFQQNYEAMTREFSDISENQTGILRIGVTYARGHALMPGLISGFQKEFPHIAVHLVEDSNELLQKHLLDGSVDLAIGNFSRHHSELDIIPFYQEQLVLLIGDDLLHQVFGAETPSVLARLQAKDYRPLNRVPFVLGIPDDIGGNIGRQFLKTNQLQPPIQAQSENLDTLLSLCALGVGACFSQENLIPMALSQQQLRCLHRFQIPDASYQIHFGIKKNSYQWNMVAAFINSAKSAQSPAHKP